MRSFLYVPAPAHPAVAFESDHFAGSTLDPRWTFVDLLGDSSIAVANSQAQITVPQPPNHDVTSTSIDAPHIRQAMQDIDFEVTIKWDNVVRGSFPSQGFLVYNSAGTWLDFKVFPAGGGITHFSLPTTGGVPGSDIRTVLSVAQVPSTHWWRITRTGNDWLWEFSPDGTTFTPLAGQSFTHAIVGNEIVLYAGSFDNTGGHTALIDYISSSDNPIT